MSTRLIVNGDDFGMSRGISDAIILAHRYGALTSTSLMTNMPAAEYAISRLAKTPHLAVGVHLNICTGRPLLPPEKVRPLVDRSGNFHAPQEMICRLWLAKASASEMEAEFCAQIQWMEDRGLDPTHADSHHHLHIYPAALTPFRRALATHGIDCTRASRLSVWPKRRLPGAAHAGSLARRVAADSYRIFVQQVALRNLRCADTRIGFCRQQRPRNARPEDWEATLANLPDGTFELVCPPGLYERGFSDADRISGQRELELGWLTSHKIRELLERRRVQLITHRELRPQSILRPSTAHEPVSP